ncbi:methyltransferase domain-containing protein, partial [Candidatus Saccharibacteria bacterium]|nr:methyltransferase domain-containing protein [Calditrichia bacterium]NIV72345.1 methyltransferase domain-containing protein [Calditrichia bacterium]NIV99753.1 methyltransferase domain-containing protein [Candidatus Saccharibacteria bacterium]NIW79655.1 methyltransferase domain-containing protein [Calditrichia bacterium]
LYAYRNKNEANKLAELIEREIPVSDYPTILDLGCGRGRHSITLAERGYHVLGIDLSKEVIAKAAQIAGKKDLPNLHF